VSLVVIHGGDGCGKPAYRWVGAPPQSGDMLRASNMTHLDGTPCVAQEVMRCGSCGKRMPGVRVEWIVAS
jgi:hypothetical protein